MKEKFKYLIPLIIVITLVLPKPVFAMIGTGIFDYFETALGGIEEISGPVTKFIFSIFLYYVVGLGVLFLSSFLLQFVLGNLSWLSVTNNAMVLSGWSFVAGITNMFFILIFVFIALATILKIETLAAKKLLPKLLIVALLVNFSLIFVGVTIDISNIFYATIIGGDTDFIPDIFSVLTKGGEDTLLMIITLVLTLVITFIIPFTSPFAQLALVVLIVATGFIGTLLIWLVQAVMFFMMSGILLTYAFLFAARIFILQLLAMVAPIAFLCSVLPQTKKYWDDWLKMVVEWNVFGVVTLLFLVVGLRGINTLLPPGASASISFSGSTLFWGNLPGYFTYYFFLFVYLVALLYFSQKYSPQLASFLIGQAKAMGGMIYAKGLKPLGRAAKPAVKKAGQWVGKKAGGGLAGWGEKQRLRGKERLKGLEGKKGLGSWLRRRGGKLRTATATQLSIAGSRMVAGAGESEMREIEEAKKKTKGGTKKRQLLELQNAMASKNWNAALGTAEAMMEDKNLSEAEAKGILGKKEYKKLVKRGKESGRKDIARHNLGLAFEIMEPEKWAEAEKLKSEGKEKKEEEIRGEAMGELFDKVIDPNKMDQVSDDSFKDKFFVKAFVDRAKGSHASQVSIHKTRATLNRIQDEIDERGVIQTIKDNPTLGKWLGTNAAQKAGLGLPELQEKDKPYIKDNFDVKSGEEAEFYDKNPKAVMWKAMTREKEKPEEQPEIRDIINDPQKLFDKYYVKETPNRVKEYIKDYLSKEEITLPPETMVKMMSKKKERLKEKLKKEVGGEKADVILNRAIDTWKEDLSEGRGGLGLTSKHISGVKDEIREKEAREAKEEIKKKEKEKEAEQLRKAAPPKKPSLEGVDEVEWQEAWKETPIPPSKEELKKEREKEVPRWVNQSITLAKKSRDKLSKDLDSLVSLNNEVSELLLERDSLKERLREFSDEAKVPATGEIGRIKLRQGQIRGEIDRKSVKGGETIERIKGRRARLDERVLNIKSWRVESLKSLREEKKALPEKEKIARPLTAELKEVESEIPLGKTILEQVEKYSKRIDKETRALEKADDEIETMRQKLEDLKERRGEIGVEVEKGKWKAKEGTEIPFVKKRVHELTRKIKELEPKIGRQEKKKRKVVLGLETTKESLGSVKKYVDSWKEEQKKKKPSMLPISPEDVTKKAKEIRTKAQKKASERGTPIPTYAKAKEMAEKELAEESEKLLTSDLGGAQKFIPSEMKKPVKEGRSLQFELKRDAKELKSLEKYEEELKMRKKLLYSELKADERGGYDKKSRGTKKATQRTIDEALREFNRGGKMRERKKELNEKILKSKEKLRKDVKEVKELILKSGGEEEYKNFIKGLDLSPEGREKALEEIKKAFEELEPTEALRDRWKRIADLGQYQKDGEEE